MRRARDAGLPAALGLIIPGLVLADYQFGLFGGAHWSYAFSSGVLTMETFARVRRRGRIVVKAVISGAA